MNKRCVIAISLATLVLILIPSYIAYPKNSEEEYVHMYKELNNACERPLGGCIRGINETITPTCSSLHHRNMITDGPLVISHFTFNGKIHGFAPFKESGFYYQFTKKLGGDNSKRYIDGILGILPLYMGVSLKPVHILAVGFNPCKLYNQVFCPFIELLIPCIGLSIRIMEDNNEERPVIVYEYNLDICGMGFLTGGTHFSSP